MKWSKSESPSQHHLITFNELRAGCQLKEINIDEWATPPPILSIFAVKLFAILQSTLCDEHNAQLGNVP